MGIEIGIISWILIPRQLYNYMQLPYIQLPWKQQQLYGLLLCEYIAPICIHHCTSYSIVLSWIIIMIQQLIESRHQLYTAALYIQLPCKQRLYRLLSEHLISPPIYSCTSISIALGIDWRTSNPAAYRIQTQLP